VSIILKYKTLINSSWWYKLQCFCRWSPWLLSIDTNEIGEGWQWYIGKVAKNIEHSRERVGLREQSECRNLEKV